MKTEEPENIWKNKPAYTHEEIELFKEQWEFDPPQRPEEADGDGDQL